MSESASSRTSRRWAFVPMLFLLHLLALIPRLAGVIGFGPGGDEKWFVSVRVLAGQIIPDDHYYPPLLHYLNAAAYAGMYAVGRFLGIWHGTADLRAQYFSNPTPFFFAGRFLTANLGALSATFAVLVADRLGLDRTRAIVVGAMVALLPIDVYLSHIAKSDPAAATALLLFAWTVLRKVDRPDARGGTFLIGFAVALALSFKQTTLFVVAPTLVGFGVMLRRSVGLSLNAIARAAATTALTAIAVWIPLNIGIVLDIRNFIEFQRALAQMSMKSAGMLAVLRHVTALFANSMTGVSIPIVIVLVIAPCVRGDGKYRLLWGSTVLGVIIFSAIAGARILPNHFLPFSVLACTLGCVAAVSLVTLRRWRVLGGALLAGAFVFFTLGVARVVAQAMASPLSRTVEHVVRTRVSTENDRILAANTGILGVQVSVAAQHEEHARHERLAAKYGVTLPVRAAESAARKDTDSAYYVRSFPWVFGGLETVAPEDVTIVKPFAWPMQREEWDLDYWIANGFNVFVVADESSFLHGPVPAYRAFHDAIRRRCQLMAVIPNKRPLFDEVSEVRIYRLLTDK